MIIAALIISALQKVILQHNLWLGYNAIMLQSRTKVIRQSIQALPSTIVQRQRRLKQREDSYSPWICQPSPLDGVWWTVSRYNDTQVQRGAGSSSPHSGRWRGQNLMCPCCCLLNSRPGGVTNHSEEATERERQTHKIIIITETTPKPHTKMKTPV